MCSRSSRMLLKLRGKMQTRSFERDPLGRWRGFVVNGVKDKLMPWRLNRSISTSRSSPEIKLEGETESNGNPSFSQVVRCADLNLAPHMGVYFRHLRGCVHRRVLGFSVTASVSQPLGSPPWRTILTQLQGRRIHTHTILRLLEPTPRILSSQEHTQPHHTRHMPLQRR